MAAPSPFHIADLQKDNEELRRKNSVLAHDITALKKAQFSKDVLLQTHEHNLRERDDRIALYIRRLAEYDASDDKSQGSPAAGTDLITVNGARHATTDEAPATSKSISAQLSKEGNSIARLASSMRPESPAFVPSCITTTPSTKAPLNIFLPSLDHSIHAFAPSSVHFVNHPSQTSQDCSADLKFSPVMQNIENGRPMLIGAVDQSTKLEVDSSQHTLPPLSILPNGGQQSLLEACPFAAEDFVESKSEVVSQGRDQLAPLISSNYGNGQTSSNLPGSNSDTSRNDPYSPLHILDTHLDHATYGHQRLQPIKQAVLTPSTHIQPKSIATPDLSDRSYRATPGGESRMNSRSEPGTTLENEDTTKQSLSEESIATESVRIVDGRPEALKTTFTRVLGSALDSESRLLVLKKSRSSVRYPWAGRQPINLRFSAVLIKLRLPNGKAMSFDVLGRSSMENVETRLYLVREETGATVLKLAAKFFPAGNDPLILDTAEGSPFLVFCVKFNLPGQINTESIDISTYPAAKSSKFPCSIREIEILRDPITKELAADIHRITFTYSEKDIDMMQLNSLDREDHKNHLQWGTETLKLFEFMALLRESSSKTISITFMNSENSSEDLIRKWFCTVRQNCELVRGISWDDGQGFVWERIEDMDGNKRWRLKLRIPETHNAPKP